MKIFHIINQMHDIGGAELMLCRLANRQFDYGYKVYVIVLRGESKLAYKKLNKGIKLFELKYGSSFSSIFAFLSVASLFNKYKPDVSQSWLYLSDFTNAFASKISSFKPKIFWGIRNTKIPQGYFSLQGVLILINSMISNLFNLNIICCSFASKEFHEKLFFKKSRMKVIQNGFDPNQYLFSQSKRNKKRQELRLKDNEVLIGNLCRFDKSKGLKDFVKTISILSRDKALRFIIQGRDIKNSSLLIKEIKKYGLENRVILSREDSDIQSFFSAIDIFYMSSHMEGFPNVLCEAMLHKRIVFSTDVGDARRILQSDDYIAPISDSSIMARKIKSIVENKESFDKLGEQNRNIISSNFSLASISKKYDNVYKKNIN